MAELSSEQMSQSIKDYMNINLLAFQRIIIKNFPKEEADTLNFKYAQLIDAIMPKLISRAIAEAGMKK